MTPIYINRQYFQIILWCFAVIAILVLLSSCGPYVSTGTATTPTAIFSPVAKFTHVGNNPLPYWQLAARDAWHIISPVLTGGKVSY